MFHYHSVIPWGSFRGRQEEKWGSFRGRDHFGVDLGDHFRAGDHFGVGIISEAVQIQVTPANTKEIFFKALYPLNRLTAKSDYSE